MRLFSVSDVSGSVFDSFHGYENISLYPWVCLECVFTVFDSALIFHLTGHVPTEHLNREP